MSRPSDLTNFFAGSITRLGFKPQTISNATAVTQAAGTDLFAAANKGALNAKAIFNFSYTTASGDVTGTIACLMEIITSDSSNLSSPTVLATKTKTITWVSDAAGKSFIGSLEANLQGAKRYVGVRFTHTKAGTVTVSAQVASASFQLGGMVVSPSSDYVRAGYAEATDTLS